MSTCSLFNSSVKLHMLRRRCNAGDFDKHVISNTGLVFAITLQHENMLMSSKICRIKDGFL